MTDTDHGDHQSIGEVLALLQQDFPDVTISKIRFLESQGLIRPERTASGYRKFFDADVDQLRWILRQQRDNFLPLKVIKKMLEDGSDRLDPGVSPQPTLWTQSAEETGGEADEEAGGVQAVGDEPGVEGQSGAHAVAAAAGSEGDSPVGAGRHPSSRERPRPTVRTVAGKLTNQVTGPVTGEATASEDDMDPAPENGTDAPEESTSARPRHQTPADVVAALQEGPGAAARQPPASRVKRERKAATSAADLSVEALQAETGITPEMLADLERYGLVTSENRGGEAVYGGDAIDIARIAVRYAELGVEARHLRMYKIAAEREAGLVEQLAMPLLKQRNPAARSQAAELADELMTMGSELHAVLLRRELGSDLGR